MLEHKLSNVLLKVADHLAGHDALYATSGSPLSYDEEKAALCVSEPTDFMTFLNSCSASKWEKYCSVKNVRLHLTLSGGACEVVVKALPKGSKADGEDTAELGRVSVEAAGKPHEVTYDVDLAEAAADLVAFEILPEDTCYLHSGWYGTDVDEARVRSVQLAISTTTFKKEQYIVPNIELMRAAAREEGDPIHGHFHMYVVDNGSTLDAEALSDDLVTVIPNENVGGAGGFARGMLACLDSGSVTHVILMDDDVHVFPESVKRTYNLLALANDEYKDAFINGAMLSVEQPNRLFEDVSYVKRSGAYHKVKPDLFVDELADVAKNERLDVEVEHAYGAWWFSCIPMANVREKGLPVPVFVRCDDVEYGLRSNPTYMTMNGICVWHESFETRQRASVDCYQYVRNFLVMAACDGHVNTELFMTRLWRNVMLRRRDLEYGAAELLLKGLEDYLRGPEWLMQADGSTLMRENGRLNDQYVPVSEIDPELIAAAHVDKICPTKHGAPNIVTKLVWTLPYDKHLLPDALLKKEPGHYQVTGASVFAKDTLARECVLVFDETGEKVAVRKMDRGRNCRIKERAAELKKRWQLEHERVAKAYKAAFPYMTSEEFWRGYLKM
jgi:galactofuranosylgalactofuranosylrhamnosyl-N-acetylglucosaminyl-diphospho-decaprenol beta-1,5/1,6-galactofuranosyltransferase